MVLSEKFASYLYPCTTYNHHTTRSTHSTWRATTLMCKQHRKLYWVSIQKRIYGASSNLYYSSCCAVCHPPTHKTGKVNTNSGSISNITFGRWEGVKAKGDDDMVVFPGQIAIELRMYFIIYLVLSFIFKKICDHDDERKTVTWTYCTKTISLVWLGFVWNFCHSVVCTDYCITTPIIPYIHFWHYLAYNFHLRRTHILCLLLAFAWQWLKLVNATTGGWWQEWNDALENKRNT